MKKFCIEALGCRVNQYEAQGFRSQLKTLGWMEVEGEECADLCIVNTCTVTESAGKQSLLRIRKLYQRHPHARMMVTGCHAQEVAAALHDLPLTVALNANKESLLKALFPQDELPEFKIDSFAGHTRSFVKVQDGCNAFCSYCIIPYVRGRSRSRRAEEILTEVSALVERGVQEVVFTGINIGDFDGQGGSTLASLMLQAAKIPALKRIRLSSIDPEDVTEELTEVLVSRGKICPTLHLVLQSGSNPVLKRMRRTYTRQKFLEVVSKLKGRREDFTFTTDVIVGFPQESEEDHQETLSVIREVGFAKVHIFPFSPRERTRAALLAGRVGKEVMERRRKEVLYAAQESAAKLRSRYVGQTVHVLMEQGGVGHTTHFLPVKVLQKRVRANTFASVFLERSDKDFLIGRVVADAAV